MIDDWCGGIGVLFGGCCGGQNITLWVGNGQKDVLDTQMQSFVDDPPVILFLLVDQLCHAISLWLPSP